MNAQYKLISAVFLFVCSAVRICSADALLDNNKESSELLSSDSHECIWFGSSPSEIETILGSSGVHQFTALISNTVVRCVAHYRRGVFGKFYFVFENDALSKVTESPAFEMRRIPYQGSWLNQRVTGDPEKRISLVMNSPNLISPDLLASLEPLERPVIRPDLGLTAAYLLTRQIVRDQQKELERNAEFFSSVQRFDPFKVSLGESLFDVEFRLGDPKIVDQIDSELEMRYYGSVGQGVSGQREFVWLSILFRSGEVYRIFSHDFLDFDKIRLLESER